MAKWVVDSSNGIGGRGIIDRKEGGGRDLALKFK